VRMARRGQSRGGSAYLGDSGVYCCMDDLTYISKGNKKTECFSFDLPAKITCPGMTEECGPKCYAAMLMRIYPAVDAKYARNLEFSNTDGFIEYMIHKIPKGCQFRIHVSGDFKDADYVRKWNRICEARPDVTFYAYTRSWAIPDIWRQIIYLHALANVNVNLSVDDETGEPHTPKMQEYRWCYLTHNDSAPDWMRADDIIFRSNHGGQITRRKNAVKKGQDPDTVAPLIHKLVGVVCPLERGRKIPNFSCKKCRLCVDKPKELSYV